MDIEEVRDDSSLIDILDRVLDKGIVVDAWIRISLLDIDLITIDACVVVASIDTYLKYAKAIGATETEGPMARQDERPAEWQTEEWPELIE
jgi:hypothetical protein